MSQKIICPKCQAEFPMEEGLKSHLKSLEESTIQTTQKQELEKIQNLEKENKKKEIGRAHV